VLIETVLNITIQRPTCDTFIRPFSVQRVVAFDRNVSKRTWIFTSLFRNLSSPLHSKEITAFLRHSEQCLFPSPQNAFCFTNLSRLFVEIFRFFEYHAQNLNTPQKNSASWDLHLGFNLVFKGLSTANVLQLHRKCVILNLSLPCSVESTVCTSPGPDEYRLYPELPASISVCPCETEI